MTYTITPRDADILQFLSEGRATPKMVAESIGTSNETVRQGFRRLEDDAGYVTTVHETAGLREITPEGERALERYEREIEQMRKAARQSN